VAIILIVGDQVNRLKKKGWKTHALALDKKPRKKKGGGRKASSVRRKEGESRQHHAR